jgi:hypothetical protein
MSTDEPGPDGENTPAAPESATTSSGSGGVLDAAPITVLGGEPQTPEPIAAGAVEQPVSPPAAQKNRRRRTGIAVATATGIVALAAAPFAMVAPQEHITSESASSPAKTHKKPPADNSASDDKKVVVPEPGWKNQGSSQPAPALPAQPALPVAPNPVTPPDSPNPWGSPSDSPAAGSDPDSSPSASPEPKRQTLARPAPAVPQHTPTATEPERGGTAKAKPVTKAPLRPRQPAKPATPNWRSKVVHGTYVLQPGQNVHTNRMRLALQTNGDLVLSDEHDKVVWSTGTHAEGTHVVFQADGNFVLYSSSNATLWSSRTDGHDGAVLVLRANGDMAITQGSTVLWHTKTAK